MKKLLRAENLAIHFGGILAADGVSLDVYEQEKLAIIGPNGAGKTTFLNICTGYLKPSAGHVWFGDAEITKKSPRQITKMGVARTFQIPQLFLEHTVVENMLIAVSARQGHLRRFVDLHRVPERAEVMHLLELVGLIDVSEQFAYALPEGMRKLLDVAIGLALRPRLLLMDEPTSGVSSQEKFEIMDILAQALDEHEVSAVFVEHDMEMVSRYADRVAVWNSGNVQMVGKPDEILNHPEVIDQVIGMGGSHAAV